MWTKRCLPKSMISRSIYLHKSHKDIEVLSELPLVKVYSCWFYIASSQVFHHTSSVYMFMLWSLYMLKFVRWYKFHQFNLAQHKEIMVSDLRCIVQGAFEALLQEEDLLSYRTGKLCTVLYFVRCWILCFLHNQCIECSHHLIRMFKPLRSDFWLGLVLASTSSG